MKKFNKLLLMLTVCTGTQQISFAAATPVAGANPKMQQMQAKIQAKMQAKMQGAAGVGTVGAGTAGAGA